MKRIVPLLLLLCGAAPCYGSVGESRWEEKRSWDEYFHAANVQGCILLYDLSKDTFFAYDGKRASEVSSPLRRSKSSTRSSLFKPERCAMRTKSSSGTAFAEVSKLESRPRHARRVKNRRVEAHLQYVAARRLSATKPMGLFQQPARAIFLRRYPWQIAVHKT